MINLKFDKYLRSPIVLTIDTITSVIASGLVVLFGWLMSGHALGASNFILVWLVGAFVGSVLSFYFTRVYRLVIRFSTLRDLTRLCLSIIFKELVLAFCVSLFDGTLAVRTVMLMLGVDFLITSGALLITRSTMLTIYWLSNRGRFSKAGSTRVLVYGTGPKGVSMVSRLRNSTHYNLVGYIEPGDDNKDTLLMGKPIHYFENVYDFKSIVERHNIEGVLFAYHADARAEQNRLIAYCGEAGIKTFIAPSIDEVKDGRLNSSSIRKIRIEDLLGRSEIKISMQEIRENFQGKTVLVTGAAGSIGSELCRQLAMLGIRELVMFDNAETPLHNVRLEFEDRFPGLYFTPVIGDVRQRERLDYVFKKFKPQVVFHAAAYKHVPLMEENPCEAVMANVLGSRQVAEKCVEYGAELMVMVSTDKAVNPTNIMGCTKRLAEIYVQSLGLAIESGKIEGKTRFVTTRFGNVLGSNGSVIPRFKEQIEKGGPVTVTDPEIRRFFMTIPEACRLVMEAATMATGTEIFVFDMGEPIKIDDLARRMITLAGFKPNEDIAIEYTGLRPGEKLYEEVLATKENTLPTEHERIFKAKVREYSYDAASDAASELERLARDVKVDEMVMMMKKIVPEFKSKHSVFEKFDK